VSEQDAFDNTPDTDSYAILPADTYGANGEAELTGITGQVHITGPNAKVPGRKIPWLRFNVAVSTDKGGIFVSSSPFSKPHTKWEEASGSKATAWLKALGLYPPQFGPADEKGNRPVLGAQGIKVLVGVGEDEGQDGTKRNHITTLEKRP
jgi:hypothetical protein